MQPAYPRRAAPPPRRVAFPVAARGPLVHGIPLLRSAPHRTHGTAGGAVVVRCAVSTRQYG
ncbi:hypothetical protein [Pseudarthrobacter sp. NPDC059871]|uniref:hypothetical protein n=1 Tax=Pseudarthrobacter sp. NPDC059871 TaxID=3346980 RepID=UPI00364B5963